MEKTTSTQFLMWKARFEEEGNDFNPDHWYFAQIAEGVFFVAHLIRNLFAKKPEPFELSLKDFLIKFEIPKEMTPEEKEEQLKKLALEKKKIWMTALGLDPETGQPKQDPRKRKLSIFAKGMKRGNRKADGPPSS